jgi:hypothetical protein
VRDLLNRYGGVHLSILDIKPTPEFQLFDSGFYMNLTEKHTKIVINDVLSQSAIAMVAVTISMGCELGDDAYLRPRKNTSVSSVRRAVKKFNNYKRDILVASRFR